MAGKKKLEARSGHNIRGGIILDVLLYGRVDRGMEHAFPSCENRYRGVNAPARNDQFAEPTIRGLTLKKPPPALWPNALSLLVATHRLASSPAVQAPNLIMRVPRKSKTVDTVKAQSLTQVRKPNLGRMCFAADRPNRFLIVSCPCRLRNPPRLRPRPLLHPPSSRADVSLWSFTATLSV